jgi:hypothetical protein
MDEADISAEIKKFIEANNWNQAKILIRKAGLPVGQRLMKEHGQPFSFDCLIQDMDSSGPGKPIYQLQQLYLALSK